MITSKQKQIFVCTDGTEYVTKKEAYTHELDYELHEVFKAENVQDDESFVDNAVELIIKYKDSIQTVFRTLDKE